MADLDIPDRVDFNSDPSQRNWDWLRVNFESKVNSLANAAATTLINNLAILKTFVNAKGDIVSATANDTPSIVSVGADLTQLIADSAQASGLRWGNKDSLLVTTLPASPSTGDTCIFTDSLTVPTYFWQLVYNGSQTAGNKWSFVGGTPLWAETAASSTTASTTYADLAAGAGPSITVPLAGDYDVTVDVKDANNGTSTAQNLVSYAIGGTAASDNDSAVNQSITIANAPHMGLHRMRRKTGLAASTALLAKYRVTTGTGTFDTRAISAIPVRVG